MGLFPANECEQKGQPLLHLLLGLKARKTRKRACLTARVERGTLPQRPGLYEARAAFRSAEQPRFPIFLDRTLSCIIKHVSW